MKTDSTGPVPLSRIEAIVPTQWVSNVLAALGQADCKVCAVAPYDGDTLRASAEPAATPARPSNIQVTTKTARHDDPEKPAVDPLARFAKIADQPARVPPRGLGKANSKPLKVFELIARMAQDDAGSQITFREIEKCCVVGGIEASRNSVRKAVDAAIEAGLLERRGTNIATHYKLKNAA